MIYIKDLTFNENYFVFSKDEKFFFEEVNLLVGDQGVGKSTLLSLMFKKNKILNISLSDETKKKGVNSYYFDFEKENPRIKNPNLYSTPSGEDIGIGVGNAVFSRFLSHGEVLKKYSVDALKFAKDCIIFLDEPETALSLKNQYKLTKEIKDAVKRNCQLFIVTHCYILISAFDNVLSLEEKKWTPSNIFISNNQEI